MKRLLCCFALALSLLAIGSTRLRAAGAKDNVKKPDAASVLTVAILDFESATPGTPELGKQISEVLTSMLAGEDGFVLVDRAEMRKILQESEINMTGLVNADQSVKIGKLVGAKILITGKIFSLDRSLFLTAKIIGAETSLVDGVLVKGEKDSDVGDLMMKLSEKVARRLHEAGPRLIARDDALEDPLPGLKKSLANYKLPRIAVEIQEHHVTLAQTAHIDPAVETEVRMVLKEAGFTIVEGDAKELADGGVTVLVGGEAFSEFAARIANLISCSARVEIKLTDRKTNEVLYVDRETTRGIDLAENMAGKSALQKAGHVLAIRILRHFEETLKDEEAARKAKEHPQKKK